MEPKERSDIVEEALNRVMHDFEDSEEGDILTDWAVVAFVANPDQEKRNAYQLLFANGEIPTYRARGLLTTGLMLLEEDEED